MAAPAFFDGISENGEVAVFSTAEQMLNTGDTDLEADVYVRAFDDTLQELVTREVSIGPRGGNDTRPARYDGISPDGTKVFFSTEEPLVQEDTDSQEDIYLRDLVHKKTVLVSKGDGSCAALGCGNSSANAGFAPNGVAADGDVVFFTSTESLNSADTDGSSDIYARRIGAEETVLVSAGDPSCVSGTCGNGSEAAAYKGADDGGDKVVFTTAEKLSPADGDANPDIYERDLNAGATGATRLVSVADTCSSEPCTLSYGAISPNGAHVFFETSEKLSGQDGDTAQDVYDWSGVGPPALVSFGPNGGNGGKNARYTKTSDDGKAVYFATTESLITADGDEAEDVYRNLEGTTTLISAGEGSKGNGLDIATLDWVSPDGSSNRAFFSTSAALVSGDSDLSQDVYERSGVLTTLVSTGSEAPGGSFNAAFAAASEDGSKVFFVSAEKLVPQDTDNSNDVYRRSAGGTVRVSFGQINGNKEAAAVLQGVSADGSKAFFTTQEPLTEGDNDAEQDIYVWSEAGFPLLVSRGNGASLGPPPPTLNAPPSPGSSTTPTVTGTAIAGADVKLYKTTGCTGPVIAEGTAAQLASPGFAVTVPAGLTTFFSATAESEGISSTCSSPISYKQEDAPPPPPEEGGTGSGGAGTGSSGSTTDSGGAKSGGTGSSGSRGSGALPYMTPLPRITFGPAAKTRLRQPTFRFLDSTGQPGTNYFCRVDRRRWAQCTSPLKVKKVSLGRHVFAVRAVNALGAPGASPAKRGFKVVR